MKTYEQEEAKHKKDQGQYGEMFFQYWAMMDDMPLDEKTSTFVISLMNFEPENSEW